MTWAAQSANARLFTDLQTHHSVVLFEQQKTQYSSFLKIKMLQSGVLFLPTISIAYMYLFAMYVYHKKSTELITWFYGNLWKQGSYWGHCHNLARTRSAGA